jgi:D-sedoheptulose 7-phosphate isomerase
MTSSGKSPNIIEAIDMAGRLGMTSIALTGFDGGKAAEICDVNINVSSSNYGVIEDAHQAIMHALAQHIGSSGMKGH